MFMISKIRKGDEDLYVVTLDRQTLDDLVLSVEEFFDPLERKPGLRAVLEAYDHMVKRSG